MAKCQHSPLQELVLMGKKPFHWKTPSYECAKRFLLAVIRSRLKSIHTKEVSYSLSNRNHRDVVNNCFTLKLTITITGKGVVSKAIGLSSSARSRLQFQLQHRNSPRRSIPLVCAEIPPLFEAKFWCTLFSPSFLDKSKTVFNPNQMDKNCHPVVMFSNFSFNAFFFLHFE